VHQPWTITEAVDHPGQHAVEVALGPSATLDGDTVGLVQHEDMVILVEDQRLDEVAVALREDERRGGDGGLRLWGLTEHGRDAHLLARFKPRVSLNASGVQSHLTGTEQLL